MAKRISDEIIEQCKKMYVEENLSCEKIAKFFDISPLTVSRRLKKLGVEINRTPHAGKFEISEVIDLYNNKTPIWKIAKIFKSSEETISKVLKENGVEVGTRSVFNHHIFDEIDTEEKAYWLGFIWADGCIMNFNPDKNNGYNFELGLAIKDSEHIEKFCDFIGMSRERIKIKYNGNKVIKSEIGQVNVNKDCYICRIQIGNKHLWNTLNNYGCCPNKTTNEHFPNESIFKSKDLIRHFIRGFVDGDGWVYIDNRGYLMSGICGQEEFLLSLIKYLPEELYKEKCIDCNNTKVIKVLKWGCNKAITFVNYLYSNSSIYLERKFNIVAPYIGNNISKLGNIGETPEMDNTEITYSIAKGE